MIPSGQLKPVAIEDSGEVLRDSEEDLAVDGNTPAGVPADLYFDFRSFLEASI